MTNLLFASKLGAIGAKFLTGAAIVKAAPFIVPIACAAVCVTATIAGAKYLSKKLSSKEPDDVSLHLCAFIEDDNADEDGISDDVGISDDTGISEIE